MRELRVRRVTSVLWAFGAVFLAAGSAAAQTPVAPAPAPVAPAPVAATSTPPPPPSAPPLGAAPAPPPGAAPAQAAYAYPPPPPGYGYPPYGYGRLVRAPETYPYQGGPIPPGFHYEERSRRGLIIGGALVLGIPWAIGISAVAGQEPAFPNSTGWLVVPGLGPWLTLAARHKSGCSSYSNGDCIDFGEDSATRTILVLDGLMQTAGAVMLIYGLASPQKVIARDFVGDLHFTPATMGKNGYGGLLTGAF